LVRAVAGRKTLRFEQERRMRELAGMLAALTDQEIIEANKGLIALGDLAASESVHAVWGSMRDLCKEERFHRRASIWYTESDMMGGHHVYIEAEENGKFTAYCSPYEESCWFGPERDTVTEALDDGRNHHPGYEPKLNPWWHQTR
jgi:hypothetical protein